MTDPTFRQRLANHLTQLNLGDTHIAYDIDGFEREIREQVAREIEQNIRTWEGMSDQATERTRGMAHAAAIALGANQLAIEETK